MAKRDSSFCEKIKSAELLWPQVKVVSDSGSVGSPPEDYELHLIASGDQQALLEASIKEVPVEIKRQGNTVAMQQLQKLAAVQELFPY